MNYDHHAYDSVGSAIATAGEDGIVKVRPGLFRVQGP